MKKLLFITIFLSLFACTNTNDYIIKKGQVGKITKLTRIKDLQQIFQNDSLVIKLSEIQNDNDKYLKQDDQYLVYEKSGKHLLTITPIKPNDSLSKLKSVEVFDNRYKTLKGISLYSPYKDINTAYNLNITNTLSSAHIDIDEINATVLIDKEEIGIIKSNRKKIRKDIIPDLAKIRHFTIWFN